MQRDRHPASGDLCRENAPLGQGRRGSLFVDLPRDETALLIELEGCRRTAHRTAPGPDVRSAGVFVARL
jgi:hypothetical protein